MEKRIEVAIFIFAQPMRWSQDEKVSVRFSCEGMNRKAAKLLPGHPVPALTQSVSDYLRSESNSADAGTAGVTKMRKPAWT